MDSRGRPTDNAVRRMKRGLLASVLAKGRNSRDVLRQAIEQGGDLGVVRVLNGVMNAAPYLVKLDGEKYGGEYSINADVAEALNDYLEFKRGKSRSIEAFIGQGDIFKGRPEMTEEILRLFADNARTPAAIADTLRKYCDMAEAQDNGTDALFAMAKLSREDLFREAVNAVKAERGEEAADGVGTRWSVGGVTPAEDAAYMEAVKRGDMETAQRMVREAAAKAGYINDSSYQGTSAFNGAAPAANGYYANKEERKAAWEDGSYEGEATFGDYIFDGIDINNLEVRLNDREWRYATPERKEAIENLNSVLSVKGKTIRMYRSVPSDVKEGSFRNGD